VGIDRLGDVNQLPDGIHLQSGFFVHFSNERFDECFTAFDDAARQCPVRMRVILPLLAHEQHCIIWPGQSYRDLTVHGGGTLIIVRMFKFLIVRRGNAPKAFIDYSPAR